MPTPYHLRHSFASLLLAEGRQALYVAQQNPLIFSDEAISQGIGSASRSALTFGVFFFDYDLDGWLDLLTINGHIEPEINKVSNDASLPDQEVFACNDAIEESETESGCRSRCPGPG